MVVLLTKVTHGVCDPKEMRETNSCGNVLGFSWRLNNTRLFVGKPRTKEEPRNLKVPEVYFLSNRHLTKSASKKL
jgi:hypothetical protein